MILLNVMIMMTSKIDDGNDFNIKQRYQHWFGN